MNLSDLSSGPLAAKGWMDIICKSVTCDTLTTNNYNGPIPLSTAPTSFLLSATENLTPIQVVNNYASIPAGSAFSNANMPTTGALDSFTGYTGSGNLTFTFTISNNNNSGTYKLTSVIGPVTIPNAPAASVNTPVTTVYIFTRDGTGWRLINKQ